MSEVVTIGDATLYLGDAREIVPTLSPPETVITDPVWPNCPAGLLAGSDDPAGLWSATAGNLQPQRLVVVMRHDSDPAMLTGNVCGLPFFRLQILPYVMPGYIGRKLGGDEIAYCYGTPIPSAPGQRVIPGYAPKEQPSGRRANGHPCSRAIGHMKWLVGWWSLTGETVLDPFMGSGTLGEACLFLGRKFVGIEIDREYFDTACERIEAAYAQGRLFT